MKKIELTDNEYEFLKDLSHELNTQDTDGTAQPVYWGVEEEKEVLTIEGQGEPRIRFDDGAYTLEELVENINENISDYEPDIQDEWKELDKEDADEVCTFAQERLKWDHIYDVFWVEKEWQISRLTGAFLTKRACKKYIETNHYHHCKPHTYALHAFRNYELETLLRLLKNLKFE